MALFDFKSNKHFVASSDGATLQVIELTKPTLTNPSSIRKTHWREVANINTALNDNDDEDDIADQTSTYDGLLFFDGHGKIEGRVALTKLAQHLKRLSLMVSPGGYCFQDVKDLGEYVDFGTYYLRLNDLFSWPHHGVSLATTSKWGRSELKYREPKQMGQGNVVSMEKYEELKRLVEQKDETLLKLKEDMDDELETLREEKEEELQELREELRKAKDEELKKLRKEKDEELRKLSKKKDGELKMLRKGIDGGAIWQKFRKEKEEELVKLRDEMEGEMEKLRKEKDDELERLNDEKEEETLKITEAKDELEKLRDQLSSTLVELTSVKQTLGQYLKSSPVLSPGARVLNYAFVEQAKEGWDIQLGRRQPVPPETFHCYARAGGEYYQPIRSNYVPTFTEAQVPSLFHVCYLVDEEITEEPLAPPSMIIYNLREGQFDVNNWWFTKTTHPEGGLTMFAYYDGDWYRFQHQTWGTIRVPYCKGADFAATWNFYMASFCGKIVFCFMYRN